MKILLMGLGNAPARHYVMSQHPENYVRDIPGYEIITFGYNEGVDIRISPDDDFRKVIDKLPSGWTPDYCFMYNLVWNLLPKGIEHSPFPTVYLALDWDYHVPLARTNAEAVDLEIVGGDYAKETVIAMGANNAEAFYDCSMMKEFFPARPKRIKDREYDIFYTTVFSNQDYLDRHKWVLKLSELSKKYNVYISESVPNYKEYLSLLQNSKLTFSHNRDGHMSFRVVEAGSQGAVILDTGEEIRKYFEPGAEFIPVDEDNFLDQVESYLRDENRLQEMSDRFYSKVKEEFESRRHFMKIMALAERAIKGRKLARKYISIPEDEKFIRRGETYYFLFFRGVVDQCFMERGKRFLELSVEAFNKALSVRKTPRAMIGLAVAVSSYLSINNSTPRKKESPAIKILNEVVSFFPSYAVAFFILGLTHFRDGNKKQASEVFAKALEKFRDINSEVDPWCLYNRELENTALAFPMGKALDSILLMSIRGEKDKAEENTRKLFQAAILYYIYLIEEGNGNIYGALEVLLESHNLYPECGLTVMAAAMRLALLGHKGESLEMYVKAINLLPLNIDLIIEYIKLLYCYSQDKAALAAADKAIKITASVSFLREKSARLKAAISGFGRFNTDSGYSHDSCMEEVHNNWLEMLYICLRKDPGNLNLVLRIIQIYDELGRIDKIFEIVDEYTSKYFNGNTSEEHVQAIKEVYDYLKGVCEKSERFYEEKLNKLDARISGLQKTVIAG